LIEIITYIIKKKIKKNKYLQHLNILLKKQ
jgi:hypothetical protein